MPMMNVKCPHSLLDSSTHSPLKLWCSLCPSNQQLNSCLQNVLFRHLAWPAAKFLPIVQTPGLTSSWILAYCSDTWSDKQLNSCLLFRHLAWPAAEFLPIVQTPGLTCLTWTRTGRVWPSWILRGASWPWAAPSGASSSTSSRSGMDRSK